MAGKSNPLYDMAPSPIEIPTATPVESMRSGGAGANAQFPPPGGTKAGGIANMAASFLHGMLAAKDVKEQKMQKTAQFSISSAWNTYQQLQGMASDSSLPEEARKAAAGKLGDAYQVYLHNIAQYTQTGDQPKKKGAKGVLSRMGGALFAQKPELGTEEMLQLMSSPNVVKAMSVPHGAPVDPEQAKFEQKKKEAEALNLKPGSAEYNNYMAGRNITPAQKEEKPEIRVMGTRTMERQVDGSWKDVGLAPTPEKAPQQEHPIEMGNSTYEKQADGSWKRIGPAKKSSEGEGTWSLQEDKFGNPVLFNSKTAQEKPAPEGLLPKGTTAKQIAARDKFVQPFHQAIDTAEDSHNYAYGNSFSGAGDDALMNQFQQVLQAGQKGTGIRFTKNEQDMLNKARSWGEGLEARTQKMLGGTYYSKNQRKQIADTIQGIANRAQKQIDDYDATHKGAPERRPSPPQSMSPQPGTTNKMAPTPNPVQGMTPPPSSGNALDDEIMKAIGH